MRSFPFVEPEPFVYPSNTTPWTGCSLDDCSRSIVQYGAIPRHRSRPVLCPLDVISIVPLVNNENGEPSNRPNYCALSSTPLLGVSAIDLPLPFHLSYDHLDTYLLTLHSASSPSPHLISFAVLVVAVVSVKTYPSRSFAKSRSFINLPIRNSASGALRSWFRTAYRPHLR